jgi:hypothetical protein
MILDYLGDLNWLAIIVAAVAWFAFSAVWYSVPPLSNAWLRAAKVTPGDGPPLVALLVPTFIGYLVTTVVIALIARAVGASELIDGLTLGIVLGIGFGVIGAAVVQICEQKGGSYWLINGINAIIAYSIVSIIVTVWV